MLDEVLAATEDAGTRLTEGVAGGCSATAAVAMPKGETMETMISTWRRTLPVLLTAALVAGAGPALAQTPKELPRAASPSEVGISADRIERLAQVLRADAAAGAIPGAVVLVSRYGRIAYEAAVGFRDRTANAPMQPDAIFRLASMTKPITTLAAMVLVEEGRLHLHEPVARWLPELKELNVGVEKIDPNGKLVLTLEPAQRPVTVQDLMRHTSGFTYGQFGNSLVHQEYMKAKAMDPQQTNAEMVTKLSRLPLRYQPGTTFEYSMSTDVLGRLIEVISDMDLERFIADRITRPLDMRDTTFVLDPAKAGRVAELDVDKATGQRPPASSPANPPKWFSGGGGLYSTARDYARFAQMLLNGGELDGVRLVSAKTVRFMASNHLPPGVGYGGTVGLLSVIAPTPANGQGFGLGFAVRLEEGRHPNPGSVGDFYWAGAFGTYFWIDPREKLFALFMTQLPGASPQRVIYRSLMRNLVYQSLAELAPPPGRNP